MVPPHNQKTILNYEKKGVQIHEHTNNGEGQLY